MIIETERLILRQLTLEDSADLFCIHSNPKTMEFMAKDSNSVEEMSGLIQKHIEKYYNIYGFGLWATILKENNILIGRCGLIYEEIEGSKDLELVYLIDCDYWGKGFAKEAAEAIIKVGFERFKFNRIIAIILPENRNSIRLAEKLGMTYEREIANYKDFGKVLLYAINSKPMQT